MGNQRVGLVHNLGNFLRHLVGQKIGKIKRENGQPIRDPEREKQVLQSRGDMSPAFRDAIEAVFAAIMAQTREVEQ